MLSVKTKSNNTSFKRKYAVTGNRLGSCPEKITSSNLVAFNVFYSLIDNSTKFVVSESTI